MNTKVFPIEKLLEFRSDVLIEQVSEDIDTLFKVTFLDTRPWTPSSTIMKELGVTFHSAGVNKHGELFVTLSTHEADAL
jgi:hypothetical protein